MKILFLTIASTLVILFPYKLESQVAIKEDLGFFEIKYEDALKQGKPTLLSLMASKVEYIHLETDDDCLISEFGKYYFSDSLIFISDRDHILKFSSDGKFLKRIGKNGRGPGEINSIKMTSIIPEKRMIAVHDATMKKITYFSFNGELIKTVSLPDLSYVKILNDGGYISYDQGLAISEKYTFCLTNESGDMISVVKNYKPWKNPSGVAIVTSAVSFEPFYTYQDKYYFKGMYNDTVYSFNGDKIIPNYYINLGKYKLPDEKRAERLSPEQVQSFRVYGPNYHWANVFESGGLIFLTTNSYGKGATNYITINKKDYNNSSKSFKGVSKGLILNDLDGGPYFWPKGCVNDNQVFMPIDVVRLKKYIEITKSGKIPIKNPELRKQLEIMVSKSDISDNPFLMVVTLKP